MTEGAVVRSIGSPAVDPTTERGVPRCWLPPAVEFPPAPVTKSKRPWDWTSLDSHDATAVWKFVDNARLYLNARYLDMEASAIPPCWPYHGGLLEDLTTLCFARREAFESQSPAPAGDAHAWHHYGLPGFCERMAQWLGSEATACRSGHHKAAPATPPAMELEWALRRDQIARLDSRGAHRPGAPLLDLDHDGD